jgi:hypothetical protein
VESITFRTSGVKEDDITRTDHPFFIATKAAADLHESTFHSCLARANARAAQQEERGAANMRNEESKAEDADDIKDIEEVPVHDRCAVFTKTRWEQRKLADVHVWGCPVYILNKMISDSKKLPHWTPRSTRTVNLGFSDKHASSVPLVLNPQTGYITVQSHIVVFDDWFATVFASTDNLPNFNDKCCQRMFRDSTYQYVLDDEDKERLIFDATVYEQAQHLLSRMQRVASAIDVSTPSQVLPAAPPPLSTPLQPPREQKLRQIPQSCLRLHSKGGYAATVSAIDPQPPTPSPIKLLQLPPTPIQPVVASSSREVSEPPIAPKATKAKSTPDKHVPRRSTRHLSLRFDSLMTTVSKDTVTTPNSTAALSNGSTTKLLSVICQRHYPTRQVIATTSKKWMKAANDEIQSLQKNGGWTEVPITDAKTRILPGTWVF